MVKYPRKHQPVKHDVFSVFKEISVVISIENFLAGKEFLRW